MILLINTSSSVCYLTLHFDDESLVNYQWNSGRTLAKGLLKFLHDKLKENFKSWSDIRGIGVFEGPGSFTGLRIGLTVMNTIADSEKIPIVGESGDDWQNIAIAKLYSNCDEKIVLPFYGSDANITNPKK